MWLLWGFTKALHLRTGTGNEISEADLGTLIRSNWHPYRSSACRLWKPQWRSNWWIWRINSGKSASRQKYSTSPLL